MPDLHKIGNESYRKAMVDIVKPTLDAGGKDSDVMVVLESTVTGVLLALHKRPEIAAGMLEEGLVPRVLERLSDYQAKHKQ